MRGIAWPAAWRVRVFFIFCFCFSFILKAEERKNELTIFAYPPSYRLSWESPKTLLKDFLGVVSVRAISTGPSIEFQSRWAETDSFNSFYMSSMGHTIVNISCELPNGENFDRWTSYSGQNFLKLDKKLILKEQLGLGVLLYDYIDGHVIEGEENYLRLTYYKSPHGWAPRYLSFPLSQEGCEKVRDMILFFEKFHFPKGTSLDELEKKNEEDLLYFTGNFEPFESYQTRLQTGRGKVGGGCAPYAVGLLKAAGIFDKLFDQAWRRPIKVSERLIGGPDPITGEIKKISPFKILFSDLGSFWQYPGYADRDLNLYDPKLIWSFIGEANACLNSFDSADCSPLAHEWLVSHSIQAEKGEPLLFKHDLEVGTMERRGHLDWKPPYRIQTTKQIVSGVRITRQ